MKRLMLAFALVLTACFNVDERPCTFACGAPLTPGGPGVCPDDYTCLNDGYCHLHGVMGFCGYSDAAPAPDLSLSDGGGDQRVPDLMSSDFAAPDLMSTDLRTSD